MRHGIYLLPNLLTTASLFAAFYAIVATMQGHIETAVIAIYSGMIADMLDGRIARLTHTQTAFGAEYDSLADMVTFGVAPSLLAYQTYLHQWGKSGWLVSFLYTAAVALRLARFNTQVSHADKRYFQGLPCPPAAGLIAAFIWLTYAYPPKFFTVILAMLMILNSLLMVSQIRYYSFKQVDFKNKVPFLYLLVLIILFIAIAAEPASVLLTGFLGFALSGPIQTLIQVQRMRQLRKKVLIKKKGLNRTQPLKP